MYGVFGLLILVWDDVYGFNMSCIKEIAYTEPLVDTVEKDAVISNVAVLYVCCLVFC